MTDDDGHEHDTDAGRWCERCNVRRLGDCSIVCFAVRDEKPT